MTKDNNSKKGLIFGKEGQDFCNFSLSNKGGKGLEGLESRLIILKPSSPKLDSITLLCTLKTSILTIFCLFPLVKSCKFQAVLGKSLATMYTKITATAESAGAQSIPAVTIIFLILLSHRFASLLLPCIMCISMVRVLDI